MSHTKHHAELIETLVTLRGVQAQALDYAIVRDHVLGVHRRVASDTAQRILNECCPVCAGERRDNEGELS
jgi:hypothetical protein